MVKRRADLRSATILNPFENRLASCRALCLMGNKELSLNKKESQASSKQPGLTIGNELRKALSYHQSGQFERAGEIYAKILKVAPFNADALNLAGVLALEEGNLAHAEKQIAAAIAADPSRPEFYNNLGNVQARQNHLNEAARSYQKAIALNPDYAAAYFNLGNANQELKKYRQAIKYYCRTLEIEPELGRALAATQVGRLLPALYADYGHEIFGHIFI